MIYKCPHCSHERYRSRVYEKKIGDVLHKFSVELEINGKTDEELRLESDKDFDIYLSTRGVIK